MFDQILDLVKEHLGGNLQSYKASQLTRLMKCTMKLQAMVQMALQPRQLTRVE